MNRSENRLLPVPVATSATGYSRSARSEAHVRVTGPYAAQLLGQAGQARGLRGGAEVLQAARTAYLGTQYGGDDDRRPPLGLIRRSRL
jgi:hypothetical protein